MDNKVIQHLYRITCENQIPVLSEMGFDEFKRKVLSEYARRVSSQDQFAASLRDILRQALNDEEGKLSIASCLYELRERNVNRDMDDVTDEETRQMAIDAMGIFGILNCLEGLYEENPVEGDLSQLIAEFRTSKPTMENHLKSAIKSMCCSEKGMTEIFITIEQLRSSIRDLMEEFSSMSVVHSFALITLTTMMDECGVGIMKLAF